MSDLSGFKVISLKQAYELGRELRLSVFSDYINEVLVRGTPIKDTVSVSLYVMEQITEQEPTKEEVNELKNMYEEAGWEVEVKGEGTTTILLFKA